MGCSHWRRTSPAFHTELTMEGGDALEARPDSKVTWVQRPRFHHCKVLGLVAPITVMVCTQLACTVDDRKLTSAVAPQRGAPDAGNDNSALADAELCTTCTAGSGTCLPGAVECLSDTELIECDSGGNWATPRLCPFRCLGGGCVGECLANSVECVSPTRARSCTEEAVWLAPQECEFACVASECAGVCKRGRRDAPRRPWWRSATTSANGTLPLRVS